MINNSKIVLINYANETYHKAQKFNSFTGKKIAGFDEVIEFSPNDIDENFKKNNLKILNQKRGNGLWLWKPYFILRTLEKVNENDYVFYCDSGAFFCRSIKNIIGSMDGEDIWISDIPLIEKQWTKPIVFEELNANSEEILDTNQMQASFICVKKTPKTVSLISKWLQYCGMFKLLSPIGPGEIRGDCISHREDQSILSVLCKKNGIKPHKDPSQFGKFPEIFISGDILYSVPKHNNEYPTIIFLHRNKNLNIVNLIRPWIKFFAKNPKLIFSNRR